PKMQELMDKIEQQLAKNPKLKPGKLTPVRREFLQLYRNYADRPKDELLSETQKCLEKAERFQEKHAAVFRPQPIDDEALLKRLAAIGSYDVDLGSKRVSVRWEDPAKPTCDWTEFLVSMKYPIGDAK